MEKRNPTQSPLPPLIDFLQIYTIHEYIYIYTHVCICYLYFRRPFWGCFDPRRQWPPWPQTETEVETQKHRKSRQNEDWNRLRFSLSRLRREGLKESVTPPHAQCVRACVCIRQIHIQILVHLHQPLRRALNLASWINLRGAMHDDIDVDACIWRIHWTSA